MKLSQVLKDWPEKEELNLVSPSDYDMSQLADDTHKYIRDLEILTEKQDTALTACDREIDREVLADKIMEINFESYGFSHEEVAYKTADKIISTLPTWLKPTERK